VADGAKLYPEILVTSSMITSTISERNERETAHLPTAFEEPRWYVAHTSANHEKRVTQQLQERSVENFLPLYDSVRRWKDRRMKLQLPLFPGYVFVRLPLRERLKVLQVPGVARLVGFNGTPTPLDDCEVESLRRALVQGVRAEPHAFLKTGRRVRITAGPLAGREGVLKRWKGNLRLVLSIELIHRSILVDVDVSSVIPAAGFSENSLS
jgi:transcription antitermination factor NusG